MLPEFVQLFLDSDASLAEINPLIVTETGEDTPQAPNPSYRNMIRAGFRLAHFRDNWAPTAQAPAPG